MKLREPGMRLPVCLSSGRAPQGNTGRSEVIRITLALAGVDCATKDYLSPLQPGEAGGKWQGDSQQEWPPPCCPHYVDQDVWLALSIAAIRHVGRKHGLSGSSLQEQAYVDRMLDGVEDLWRKFLVLTCADRVFAVLPSLEAAKAVYWQDVVQPAQPNSSTSCGVTNVQYLSILLQLNVSGQGWAVGSTPSIADVVLYYVMAAHCRLFSVEAVEGLYPSLISHMRRFAALPRIASYLQSRQGQQGWESI